MVFEYFYTMTAVGSLEIDDVGNCAIQACNDDGCLYYFVTQTTLGWTKIFEYGPCMPDFDELPKGVSCNFSRIDYDDRKISKRIDEFINNKYRQITSATLVEEDVVWEDCKSIIEYMQDRNNF